MATTAILELRLKPDAVDAGLEVVHRILGETRAFDGCLGVTVVQDASDPARLVAIEEWESPEKDAAYREWRAGDGAMPDLAALLAGPPNLLVGEARADI
ncbi:MAG TPA: antibiotic biosynthesis monooxygenase family protein [Solirubrobacterales bacterium]|nr:antibiotic biosynthesis monooxygenase family protein [Solirubrobacterales bacterium]